MKYLCCGLCFTHSLQQAAIEIHRCKVCGLHAVYHIQYATICLTETEVGRHILCSVFTLVWNKSHSFLFKFILNVKLI